MCGCMLACSNLKALKCLGLLYRLPMRVHIDSGCSTSHLVWDSSCTIVVYPRALSVCRSCTNLASQAAVASDVPDIVCASKWLHLLYMHLLESVQGGVQGGAITPESDVAALHCNQLSHAHAAFRDMWQSFCIQGVSCEMFSAAAGLL